MHRVSRHQKTCCLTTSQVAKLVEPNARYDANEQDQSANQDSPKLDLQHILVVVCLRRKSNSRQHRKQDHVSTNTVVLVQLLGVGFAAVELRDEVLGDANHSLQSSEDVGD